MQLTQWGYGTSRSAKRYCTNRQDQRIIVRWRLRAHYPIGGEVGSLLLEKDQVDSDSHSNSKGILIKSTHCWPAPKRSPRSGPSTTRYARGTTDSPLLRWTSSRGGPSFVHRDRWLAGPQEWDYLHRCHNSGRRRRLPSTFEKVIAPFTITITASSKLSSLASLTRPHLMIK